MSDVQRHRPPLRVRAEEWTETGWFAVVLIAVSVAVSLLCVGGFVYAVQSTDDPGYQPPRNSYMRSHQ